MTNYAGPVVLISPDGTEAGSGKCAFRRSEADGLVVWSGMIECSDQGLHETLLGETVGVRLGGRKGEVIFVSRRGPTTSEVQGTGDPPF